MDDAHEKEEGGDPGGQEKHGGKRTAEKNQRSLPDLADQAQVLETMAQGVRRDGAGQQASDICGNRRSEGVARGELSKRSKYYLPKEDYLTVKHFCLRYPLWVAELSVPPDTSRAITYDGVRVQTTGDSDPCAEVAMRRAEYARKKELVDRTIMETAPEIAHYLMLGVCYGVNEKDLEAEGMPCMRDMYYDRRRKFYWAMAHKI